MKKTNILGILLITLLVFGVTNAIAAGDHGGDHHDEVADHCTTATEEIHINASSDALRYDKSEYHVEKNTCYELIFTNEDEITEHDVNIDEEHDYEFDKVHIHVANHTDGDHGTKTMHIQTPDADTELTIYCSVAGHRTNGMEATLIVGAGNVSEAPFNAFYGLLALAFLVVTVPVIRKK